jgi:hypothetical protein
MLLPDDTKLADVLAINAIWNANAVPLIELYRSAKSTLNAGNMHMPKS